MGLESTKAKTYSGTFPRSLDAKKRVAIPSGWVSGEGDEFLVAPHPKERFLMIMREEELGKWEQKFQESAKLNPQQKRLAIRAFYASARAVSTDKQGRILLPESHCEWAQLDGEVVFLGSPGRIEIWSVRNHQANESANRSALQAAAEESGL
jgi:MraZ protein